MLGVSDATLRRYARAYERVFDDLRPHGEGPRLFAGQVLDRLSAAKAMQEAGKATSIEQALLMLRDGVEAPVPVRVTSEALDVSEEARAALMAVLRDELRAIVRDAARAASEEAHQAQADELRAFLREELQAALQPEANRELEELRKMNAHLLAELERRRLEAEQPKRRPWWRWWWR
jgi:DNA-binding transcriptional MerR regulator